MRSLALGWRLARRSWRESLGRTASMALGMVLAGFVAAAILGLPAVFDGKNERRAETVAASGETQQVDSATQPDLGASTLLGQRIIEQLGDRHLDRIVLAGTGELPPGVSALPQPGEIVMSQALAALAGEDALVAQRFPQNRIGQIADDGLVEPGALVAYVGVEPDERLYPMSFGTTDLIPVTGSAEVRIVMVLSGAFLALPAGAFLATSSRLSARARNQRLASLRLLGLSRRAVRTVNAVETAAVAAVGSVLGCLLWAGVQPLVGRRGVSGFRWFATDAPLRPAVVLAIAAVSTIGAVAVATVTANDAIDEPLATGRQGAPTVRVWWRAVVLVAGAAMLIAASLNSSTDRVFFILLVAGGFASAVGTALSTPLVSQALGTWLGSRRGGTTRMLVARRLRHEPSAAGRVLTGVLVATFALGVGQGVIGAFNDASFSASDDPTFGIGTNLTADQIAELPGVVIALPQIMLDGGEAAWAATCAQLEIHLAQSLPKCVDGEVFELTFGVQEASYGVPILVAEFPSDSLNAINGLIIPPAQAETHPVGWTVRADPALRAEFDAALVGADPVAFTGSWPEDSLADLVAAVITAGAIAGFTIGLAAVVVATADRSLERRALDANLLAVGIPSRFLRRAQLWTVSLPVAVTVTMAAVIGTLAGHVYRQAGSDIELAFPWGGAVISSGAGLAAAALAGGLAFSLAQTRLAPGDLRTT